MKHFFTSKQESKLSQLKINIINGKLAERYFASILTTALDARVSFTSRTEDDAKLDLVTIMSHPWKKNTVEILFTQVKSGKTYAQVVENKLIVNKDELTDLLNRNHNSLICWTEVNDDNAYWFFIKAKARFFKTEYNISHKFSPLTKFDLLRLTTSSNDKNGGSGLIFNRKNIRSEYSKDDYVKLRNEAKLNYKKFKKEETINPLFGKIEFTRLGWRHITRESRWYRYEVASLEIIRILDKILSLSPSNHYIINCYENNDDTNFSFREVEYLLSYEKVKAYNKETHKLENVTVFIKLLEIGTYLKEWKQRPKNTSAIYRRVIFKSIYYKQSS
ncbi:DUF4365 domain-containing protein [Flavobacterium stagni]|uniref:DUF4365 domain-containing protein n=1 Tax=Flavobacterium stagni TaxID=2506421 RepID=A0A4Q1KAG3_9FLAO|nr:DUF4365 domain-containing protein [Flavobacterium stagni]RXR23040.1 DUF4365 domain-containing protein [Flavobacterium stagni]